MFLDASLLNTQHYKVKIKDKWSNPGKGVVAIEKGAFGLPLTTVNIYKVLLKAYDNWNWLKYFEINQNILRL